MEDIFIIGKLVLTRNIFYGSLINIANVMIGYVNLCWCKCSKMQSTFVYQFVMHYLTSTHFWCLCNQSIWGTSFEYYYAVASTGKMEDLLDLSLSTGLMPLQKNSFESWYKKGKMGVRVLNCQVWKRMIRLYDVKPAYILNLRILEWQSNIWYAHVADVKKANHILLKTIFWAV